MRFFARNGWEDHSGQTPSGSAGRGYPPEYYRATKWLTVLIFRPLTGK
jgi:hypothetical protein